MDALTLFGLFAVTAMLVLYALEERGPHYILGFALACGLGSAYGFLQGAWPFGVVEAICCRRRLAALDAREIRKLAAIRAPRRPVEANARARPDRSPLQLSG
jgi:hypothetical protein